MSLPDRTLSPPPTTKTPQIIKLLVLLSAIIVLTCLWFIVKPMGFTPVVLVCVFAILALVGLCFWGHSSNAYAGVNAPVSLAAASDSMAEQKLLYQSLPLLHLADKQQLLETVVNKDQLIATKQTFEQCCAWQFNDPDTFDCVDLSSDVQQLASLNIHTGKANYKHGSDKQNTAKVWQQLLSSDLKTPCSCQYEVTDENGKSVKIVETWVLSGSPEQVTWYRAIGIASKQNAALGDKPKGQMLLEEDKMQALVRFADGIAHDYNNLFGIVNGYIELMEGVLDNPDKIRSYIEQIQSASTRAGALGDQILALSRRRKAGMKLVDFEQAMIEPLFIFKKNLPETVKFDWVLGKSHHQIKLDPSKLEEVLFAIGENAITAMDAKGSLRIVSKVNSITDKKAEHLGIPAGEYLCFSVIDNGCGMDEYQLSQALEPYYSTTGGSGFGLASVYGFMKTCDGALGIDSSLGQGTRVSLYFPLIEQM